MDLVNNFSRRLFFLSFFFLVSAVLPIKPMRDFSKLGWFSCARHLQKSVHCVSLQRWNLKYRGTCSCMDCSNKTWYISLSNITFTDWWCSYPIVTVGGNPSTRSANWVWLVLLYPFEATSVKLYCFHNNKCPVLMLNFPACIHCFTLIKF